MTIMVKHLLAPAVTGGATEGAMESGCVRLKETSRAYNLGRKQHRLTIFGMWFPIRMVLHRLQYFSPRLKSQVTEEIEGC